MAVDADSIAQGNLILPAPNHPMIQANGLIDPIWYRYLADLTRMVNSLKTLANATKSEVDTQHP